MMFLGDSSSLGTLERMNAHGEIQVAADPEPYLLILN